MNFLIFSAQYLPHMGGIENYTYNISKKLIERGHSVSVVTSNTTQSESFETKENINIYRLDCFNFLNGRYPIYKKNAVYRKILDRLNKEKFDLTIINARFYFHSLLGAKYSQDRAIPCIVIDHGTSHLTVHNKLLDCVGGGFEHFITKLLKRKCTSFYAVSKASSEWLKHFKIQSKGEIYNAIDLDTIEKIKLENIGRDSYRRKYCIPDEALIFTFTGRLLKEKGVIQLVESVEKWNNDLSNRKIYLFLAGEGILSDYLKEHQSQYIIPLGRLPFKEVIHLLEESNVFVLPSDSEGFSTSLLEAAACHNYLITTLRGGAKELLPDDSYGLIIENNKVEDIFDAIKKSVECFNRKKAVEKTYERVKNNFTWNQSVDKVISIIQNKD